MVNKICIEIKRTWYSCINKILINNKGIIKYLKYAEYFFKSFLYALAIMAWISIDIFMNISLTKYTFVS